jgi:hypothetical protein
MKFLLIAILVCFISHSYGQDRPITNQNHQLGFMLGWGAHELTAVKYTYVVKLFQIQYYTKVFKTRDWSFEILFQPQYNATQYKLNNTDKTFRYGFEYGLNIAALVRKYLFRNHSSIYGFIGSGPHYTSGAPRRQSPGFIFSDNLFLGITFKTGKNLFLDFRLGVRHLSNAGIKEPNAGVKNTMINGGILFFP